MGKKEYGKEEAEETKLLSPSDDEFDGADNKFEEARAEENAFDRSRAEESTARTCSQTARNMYRYAMGTADII